MRLRVSMVTLLGAAVVALTLGMGSAGASPTCTDTFLSADTGGDWGTAADWSTGSVPTSSDVACWSSGTLVNISSSDSGATASSVQGGQLVISGTGRLTLGSASTLVKLTVSGVSGADSLDGPGALTLTGAFLWTGGSFGITSPIAVTQTGSGTFQVSGSTTAALDNGSTLTASGNVSITNTNFIGNPGATLTASNGTVSFAAGSYNANGNPNLTINASGFVTGGATSIPNYVLHLTGSNSTLGGDLTVPELDTDAGTLLTVPSGVNLTPFNSSTIAGTVTGQGTFTQATGITTIASTATFSIDNLHLSGGAVNVATGANYDVAGSTTVSGGVLSIAPNTAATGDLTINGAGAILDGPGTLAVRGNFSWSQGVISNTQPISITQTGGGSFSISGSSQAYLNAASITTTSPVSITNPGFITASNGTLTTTSTITFANGLNIPVNGGANATFTAAGVNATGGGSQTYGFGDDYLVLTGGITDVASGDTLTAHALTIQGGTLTGAGTLADYNGVHTSATAVTNAGGLVQPTGASTLTINGSYTQGSGGTLAIPVAGTASGQHGLLDITGSAILGGTLNLQPTPGYVGSAGQGDAIGVLSYGGLSGTFAQVTSTPALNTGQSFGADYSQSGLVRAVVSGQALQPPINTQRPAVTGTPSPGGTLTCSNGSWTNNPTSYAITWSTGTAGASYTIQPADQGHSITCTVVASNAAGAGAPATSAAVNIPNPPPGKPTNTEPPHITVPAGGAVPGDVLSCSSGTWTGNPTSFTYQWDRNGTPIPGATSSTYSVQIADEATELTCVVMAYNAAGAATSQPVLVAVPGTLGCPKPGGHMGGKDVGPLAIGMSRSHARHILKRYRILAGGFDDYCLFAGWGIRAGYPTAKLLDRLPAALRRSVSGRIVIALTANPFYALHGVRAGMTLSGAFDHLHLGRPLHLGANYWLFAPAGAATAVLKVRAGVIEEIGLADSRLTRGHAAQSRLLLSFQ